MEKRVRQLNIGSTAEEMDKRTSVARRLNKNENNRLRQQYQQFRDNHEVLTIEINQEMKKIQNELNGIREISGYKEYARNSGESAATVEHSSSKRKRKQKSTRPNQRSSKTNDMKLRRKLTFDESVRNNVRFGVNVKRSGLMAGKPGALSRDLVTAPASDSMPQIASTHRRTSRSGLSKKEDKLPQINMTSATTDSRALDSVSDARQHAKKRLVAGQTESNDIDESALSCAKATDDDDDVESYMYVPPDGRKRTVYLIPPLEDLLKEASKARYLRIPKRLLGDEQEDPERELSIDDIFSK